MTAIEISELTHVYGRRRGIEGICLSVASGEIFGFLGPNGAGKSTTIRILMGLLRAASGSARMLGLDCWRDGVDVRRRTGYVPGDVRLYSWLNLHRGLQIVGRVHGRDVRQAGLEYAERFRLEPGLPARKMSRGNRQKLALVLALAPQPELLILDEPTSGLDPLMQDTLMLCLRERAQAGSTVLFSSHTLSEVEAICDRVAMIRQGQLVENGAVAELQRNAPRQLRLRLRPGQPVPQEWPSGCDPLVLPGQDAAGKLELLVPPGQRDRTCVLQFRGSSANVLEWAMSCGFEDLEAGPPSLETLFRMYYEEDDCGGNRQPKSVTSEPGDGEKE